MKHWVQFLLFACGATLFADKYEASLRYSGQIPYLKLVHTKDDGTKVAEVEYKFWFNIDALKQSTLVCKTPQVDWAPIEKVEGDPKLSTDGLGVRVGGLLLWLRNNFRNDGLVVSGETDNTFEITANRIVLGNNRDTHLRGNLTLNPLQDKPTVMVRGEVIIDGNCAVNSQRLYIDKDARWCVRGTILGDFKELKPWRRAAIQTGRLEAPALVKFENSGTWVTLGDFVAPLAVVKNVECDNSKIPETASTLGQLVVNGNCRVKSLTKETIVNKQRNITMQLAGQFCDKRNIKTFLADIEVERIRKQMLHLVGRTLLPGFTNELDQLWQFYKNTVEEHHRLKVEDGLAMELGHVSKKIWEHLKKDIVWLYECTIDGEKLMTLLWIPCRTTLETLRVSPAMVVAGELNITADGNWANQGLIEATRGDVKVTVEGVAQNSGGAIISRNGEVRMQAGVGIVNTNGLIQGAADVKLMAPLVVAQTEAVRSGSDAVFHAVTGGEAEIKSGGDISIEAGSQLILQGSRISADGDVALRSGDVLHVVPSVLEYRVSGSSGSSTHDIRGRHGIFSYVAGRNVILNATGEVVLEAPRMQAAEDFSLRSRAGRVQIRPFWESEYAHYTWESSGFFSDASGSVTDLREHLVRPEIVAGRNLRLCAHDDLDTTALSAQARHMELVSETGDVRLQAGREQSFHQEEYEDEGFFTTTVHNEGYNNVAVIEPLMVHDDVRVIGRLMTEVKKGHLAPWVVDLCAMYEVDLQEVLETHEQWYQHTTQMSIPLRTFLSVALTICTAGWGSEYIAAHCSKVSTAVAKGVGAALEGITNTFAVSIIANGGDLGKVFKEITDSRYLKGLIASALASGLVSKFIDTPMADKALAEGDKAVQGAVDTAKAASKSAASVGLAAEKATVKGLNFAQNLGRNLRSAALTTGVTAAVCGGKVAKDALSSLGCAVVDAGVGQVAREIGTRYAHGSGDMSWLTHKVCHFVLGGVSAELTGRDFLAGGAGAAVGEMVADRMIQRALERTRAEVREQLEELRDTYGEWPPIEDAEALTQLTYLQYLESEQAEQIQRIGRLVAAGTALVGHMDIEKADAAADLAIEHNSIGSQIKVLRAWLGANYKQITYDGLNFIVPIEALGNLTQGKDIITSLAEIGLCAMPIGKVGKGLKFLAVKVLDKNW